MASNPEPASYGALAGETYRSLVGAAEAVNAETIAYMRSLLGIVTKPYPSRGLVDLAKEQVARSAAILGATLDALDGNNRHAADLAKSVAGIVSSAHDTYVAALRGIADAGISNIDFVKDTAARKTRLTLPMPSAN